jgi:hypothetical protein
VTSTGYARSVMRVLAEIRGPEAAVALTPRDWALLLEWESRGVPLATVLEALRDAPGRRRSRRAPRGPLRLSDVAPAVEEAWQVLRSGSLAPAAPEPTSEETAEIWVQALEAAEPASPLASLLEALLARWRLGARAEDLDAALDEGLAGAAPKHLREDVESEVRRELAPFRSLMAPDAFAATHALTVRDRLRKALRLPRIS